MFFLSDFRDPSSPSAFSSPLARSRLAFWQKVSLGQSTRHLRLRNRWPGYPLFRQSTIHQLQIHVLHRCMSLHSRMWKSSPQTTLSRLATCSGESGHCRHLPLLTPWKQRISICIMIEEGGTELFEVVIIILMILALPVSVKARIVNDVGVVFSLPLKT